jgi:hypothetical protein
VGEADPLSRISKAMVAVLWLTNSKRDGLDILAQYESRCRLSAHPAHEKINAPPMNVKNAPKKVCYNGRCFASLMELAEFYSIPYGTLNRRLRNGWSIDEAIKAGNSAHAIVVGGERFHSVVDACRNFSFNQEVIYSRLKYGWDPDQAFELKPAPGLGPGIIGLIYEVQNLKTHKRYIGQTKATVEERWKWHLAQVTRGPSNPLGLHKAISDFGADCFTIRVLAKCNSIGEMIDTERNLIQEMNTLAPNGYNIGLGGEGAKSIGTAYEIDGDRFPSLMSAARHYRINYCTLCDRIENGWSVKTALKTPAAQRNKGYVIN